MASVTFFTRMAIGLSCLLQVTPLMVSSIPWVTNGSNATISCSGASARPFTDLQWRLSNVNVTDVSASRTILQYNLQSKVVIFNIGTDTNHYDAQEASEGGTYLLIIRSVTLDDGGKYWCRLFENPPINNTPDDIGTSVIHIRVPPSSSVIIYNGTVYGNGDSRRIIAGNYHQFTCSAPGVNPAANITWTLPVGSTTDQPQGTQVDSPNSDDDRLVDSANMMILGIPESPATSQLTCGATNRQDGLTDSEDEASITLVIRVPPKMVKLSDSSGDYSPGTSVAVNQGTLHRFACLIQGTRPAATIQWFVDDVMPSAGVVNPTSAVTNDLYDTTGSWSFTPTRVNHGQEVKCLASTAESEQPFPSAVIILDVNGPPDTPVVTGSTPFIEDVSVRLTCQADGGYPNDWQLAWFIGATNVNSSTILSDSSNDRYMFISMFDFTPTREDNWKTIIKCAAHRGSRTAAEEGSLGPIDVHYEGNITNKEANTVAAKSGTDAVLICTAKANPIPVIEWYSPDSTQITSGTDPNKFTVEHTTTTGDDVYGYVVSSMLTITDVNSEVDYGVYTCNTSNGIGADDSLKVNLTRTRRPSKPHTVRIIDQTEDSLTVTWTAGYDGGEQQWFQVSHRRTPDPRDQETFSKNIPSASEQDTYTYKVTGLDAFTEYEIRIYAENAVGRNPDYGSIKEYTLPSSPTSTSVTSRPTQEPSNNTGVIVGVIVGAILLSVIVVLGILLRRRMRNQTKERSKLHELKERQERPRPPRHQSEAEANYLDITEMASMEPANPVGGSAAYANVPHAHKDFPRDQLKIIKELGHGAFGLVLLAEAAGIIERSKVTSVAVKTLKEGAGSSDRADMMRELELMKKLPDHPNVVKLLGFCVEQDPLYIIVEYLSRGNLKDLLKDSRSKGGRVYGNLHGTSKSLASKDLMKFSKDAADGMAFISSQQCIHRDLAARNILVAEDMTCKVSDFGLARDVTNTRVYERQSQGNLPLRWMALESVLDDIYTTESDVWSYGVLLWEIVTLGARPYPAMSAKMMLDELRSGYRMPKPQHCQEDLYEMMLQCWQEDPEDRPTFTMISNELSKLMDIEKDYISIQDYEETVYEVTLPKGEHEKV